jgi:hypothetical protein
MSSPTKSSTASGLFGFAYRLVLASAMVCMLCLVGVPAQADTIESLKGAGTAPCATAVCPSPAFVSVFAQFDWDVTTGTVVPNTMSVTSFGGLGQFSFLNQGPPGTLLPLISFQNLSGDIIGLFPIGYPNAAFNLPAIPGASDQNVTTITCATPTDACSLGGFEGEWFMGTWTVLAVATPEGSSLSCLLAGMVCVGLLGISARWRRREGQLGG